MNLLIKDRFKKFKAYKSLKRKNPNTNLLQVLTKSFQNCFIFFFQTGHDSCHKAYDMLTKILITNTEFF